MIDDERLCIWTWRRMLEMIKEEWRNDCKPVLTQHHHRMLDGNMDRAHSSRGLPRSHWLSSRRTMDEQTWQRGIIILMLAIFMVVIAWLQGEEEE